MKGSRKIFAKQSSRVELGEETEREREGKIWVTRSASERDRERKGESCIHGKVN